MDKKKVALLFAGIMLIPFVIADGNLTVSMNIVSQNPSSLSNFTISSNYTVIGQSLYAYFTCNDPDGLLDLSRCEVDLLGVYGENQVWNIQGALNKTTGNCTASFGNYVVEAGEYVVLPVCYDLSELNTTGTTELGSLVKPSHSVERQLSKPILGRDGQYSYTLYSNVILDNTASTLSWSHTWNYSAEDNFGAIVMSSYTGSNCGSGTLKNTSTTTNLYWTSNVSQSVSINETVCLNYTSALNATSHYFQDKSLISNLSMQYYKLNVTVKNHGQKSNISFNISNQCPSNKLMWGSEICMDLSILINASPTNKTNSTWNWAGDNLTEVYSPWVENETYTTSVESQLIYKSINVTNGASIDMNPVGVSTSTPFPGACELCNANISIGISTYSGTPFYDEGDGIDMIDDITPYYLNEYLNASIGTTWYYWNMTINFSVVSDINFTDVSYNVSMEGLNGGFVSPCVAKWNSTTMDIISTLDQDWICMRTSGGKVITWDSTVAVVGDVAELLTFQPNPDNVNWSFVNASYKNIKITRTAGETRTNWYLYYYNSSGKYEDVTGDPTYAFYGHGTNISFVIPNVSQTRTDNHLIYFKIEGYNSGGGASPGGGGGAPSKTNLATCQNKICEVGEDVQCPVQELFSDCDGYCNYNDNPDNPFADKPGSPDCPSGPPSPDNLTVIFEITPRTIDPVQGPIPAPFQAIGSVCRAYHVRNIGSSAGNVELLVEGNVYTLPGKGAVTSADWVSLNWNGTQYLLIGEERDVEICVSYPEGADSTYQARVTGKSFGKTEFLNIIIQPPLITQLLKFLIQPTTLVVIGLIIFGMAGLIIFSILRRK